MNKNILPGQLTGVVDIPPSKSDAQRALLAAALSKGTSTIRNCGTSQDVQGLMNALIQLGVSFKEIDVHTFQVTGIESWPKEATLNIGESGLACRLMTTVLAVQNGKYILTGEGSLLKRPMPFYEIEFPKMGLEFVSKNGFLPFQVEGVLHPGDYTVDGSQSSQYISGLLMALPLLKGETRLRVEQMNSAPYIFMTLQMLKKFGIQIERFENEFLVPGMQSYLPCDYTVEGDWSAASYWLVAAALGHDVLVSGLKMNSLQADKQLLNVLTAANCRIYFEENGIRVDGANRCSFSFDATDCPDLFPALVLFAALTDGVSQIRGVSRLKDKESNRGVVLQEEFNKLGVRIEIEDEVLVIHGKSQLQGGNVDSHNDHRIAMTLAIAGTLARNSIDIASAEAVAKSYPEFWQDMEKVMVKL